MSRFIDADKARAKFSYSFTDYPTDYIKALIDDVPTADVAPVIHGHWERSKKNPKWIHCSVCEYEPFDDGGVAEYYNSNIDLGTTDYCPNCGAKMDEVET